MTNNQHDAYVSPRVAADLCDVPIARVDALIQSGDVRAETIRRRLYVNVGQVSRALAKEGGADGRDADTD